MLEVAVKRPASATAAADGAATASGAAGAPLRAACAIGFGGVVLALLWSRTLGAAYLVAAAVPVALVGMLARRAQRAGREAPPRIASIRVEVYAALAILLFALAAGSLTAYRLSRITADWDRLVEAREARLAAQLDRRMGMVLARGHRAAELAAQSAVAGGADRFAELEALRKRTGVAALAVFREGGAGDLVAWAGDHGGAIPYDIRSSPQRVAYAERPLFSYLYFSQPVEGRGERAIAAILLETSLPLQEKSEAGFAADFAARTGVLPLFGEGASPNAAWYLVDHGDTILHARFEPISQARLRGGAAATGRRIVLALSGIALLLLSHAWLRLRPSHLATAAPLASALIALAIAPLGPTLRLEALFSPTLFLLPFPVDVSLGRFFAVLLPLAALAMTLRSRTLEGRAGRVWLAAGALVVAISFPLGMRLVTGAAGPSLLESSPYLWWVLQPASVLLLSLGAGLTMPEGRPAGRAGAADAGTRAAGPGRERGGPGSAGAAAPLAASLPGVRRRVREWIASPPVLIAGGVLSSAVLAILLVARWTATRAASGWLPALWAAPFLLLALGLAARPGRRSRLLRWLAAGWLAASLVTPYLWTAHLDARLRAAERDIATLGSRADPLLDYLLRHFAEEALRRHAAGEDGLALLYRSWVASDLAREGYPARITLWTIGRRAEFELPVGGVTDVLRRGDTPPRVVRQALDSARVAGAPVIRVVRDVPDINEILAVPLGDGREISVVVPPRRTLTRAGALAPFLDTAPGPGPQLTLILANLSGAHESAEIRWRPVEHGWRSETLVHIPGEGDYHAHVDLRMPSRSVRVARAFLLLALDLGLLTLLWAAGRAARGDPPAPPGGWTAWLGTFRARVTLALFGFFLLPTVLFGAVAYRGFAGEVTRAARVLAERAVAQAADSFPGSERRLDALAASIGEDVLYYHPQGDLADASSREAFEMGIYGAWMPPDVFATLQSGEETTVIRQQRLVDRPYLFAYRALRPTGNGTMAVPISLYASDAVVRQREFAHLVLFASLVGGLLSLALSVFVGRALARPIGQLRRAATAVGAGRLRARLPEDRADEFGELFAVFNRMVRRLREARAKEVRTARVLAWGEMARQVAHEIKNPLTPIKLSVQHLRRAYADRHPAFGTVLETNVDQILAEIDRLTEIARAFSRYGAPPEAAGPLEAVDVAMVVREALTLYRAGDSGIRYEGVIEEGLPRAVARTGELKEVILNLLENAHAALNGSGNVEVHAYRADDAIEVMVRDDGPGIPEELATRVFEPHFSTRSAGTGLGLAIVRRLVESWGGTVSAVSHDGRGAAMRIRMRVAAR